MQAIEAGAQAGPGASFVLDLGDTAPDRRPIRINGRVIEGWVTSNKGAPRLVFAAIRKAADAFREAANGGDVDRDLAWEQYVSRLLVAVLPGLTYEEADLLDFGRATLVLTELGVFQPLDPPETEAAERPNPPAARPSTGARRRRGSPASTG